MQQRSVRRVCARVAFVDLFAARIKNLDAAEGRLNFFRKPNANLVRRCLERTTHSRLRGLEKSVSFNSRRTSQDNHKQAEDRPFHLLPPNIGRPRLRGKRSSRKKCSCAITPTLVPVRSLIGTTASKPTWKYFPAQMTPGLTVPVV